MLLAGPEPPAQPPVAPVLPPTTAPTAARSSGRGEAVGLRRGHALPPAEPQEPEERPDCLRDPERAIRDLLRHGGPRMVFQPQLSLTRLEVAGYEALARFPGDPEQDPERWFRSAHAVGLGEELEGRAVANALLTGSSRPKGTLLAVNVSPALLGSEVLPTCLPTDLDGIEIELTEQEALQDPDLLRWELSKLRERGAHLAIDDVGAAHSGLRRVMDLRPDTIKLDRHLVDGVASSSSRTTVVRAVVEIAEHIGATVCAEGVERLDDLLILADLDVALVQGRLVASPAEECGPVDDLVVAACRNSLQRSLCWPIGSPLGTGHDPRGTSATDLEDLLGRLAEVRELEDLAHLAPLGAQVVHCDALALSLLCESGQALHPLICRNGRSGAGARLSDRPAARACLDERRIIPLNAGEQIPNSEQQILTGSGHSGVLLVPVNGHGRTLGLLECYLTTSAPWTRRQIRRARVLASVIGPVTASLLDRNPAADLR
jgi:EAL domain-containing protein (putative c-di-GMP-specific phosphodiesterase class I)